MKQVILNLAINAVQAMDAKGEIVFAAPQRDASVIITVRDQGPGIREEDLDRIFNPFFATKEGGSGLGLSVVYQIVNQHGGVVNAARNPDLGMAFSLKIPLVQRSKVE